MALDRGAVASLLIAGLAGLLASGCTRSSGTGPVSPPASPRAGTLSPDRAHAETNAAKPLRRPRRIVIKLKEAAPAKVQLDRFAADPPAGVDASAIASGLDRLNTALGEVPGLKVEPLFDLGVGRGQRSEVLADLPRKALGESEAELRSFWRVTVSSGMTDDELRRLLEELRAEGSVETVYEAPEPARPPQSTPATPDFEDEQFYLDAVDRHGIDARAAWSVPGGDGAPSRGKPVRIVDVEYAWVRDHEEWRKRPLKLLEGDEFLGFGRDHGTAVVGMLGAAANRRGVTGITPRVEVLLQPTHRRKAYELAQAILNTTKHTGPGDIVLIEQQLAPPDENVLPDCPPGCPCKEVVRYLPVEYEPAVLLAVKVLIESERIVVVTAGNGYNDLDGVGSASGFSAVPFHRGSSDSGAIYVGAGQSYRSPVERAAHCYSNFGSRLDLQGIGDAIVTTGYGDLSCQSDPRRSYTQTFEGTSSSAPLVASAAASIQGAARSRGFQYTPAGMRDLLRRTGTAETGTRHIGPRPDLKQALEEVLADARGRPIASSEAPRSPVATP